MTLVRTVRNVVLVFHLHAVIDVWFSWGNKYYVDFFDGLIYFRLCRDYERNHFRQISIFDTF